MVPYLTKQGLLALLFSLKAALRHFANIYSDSPTPLYPRERTPSRITLRAISRPPARDAQLQQTGSGRSRD